MEQPPEVAETEQSSQAIQPLKNDMFDMFDIFDKLDVDDDEKKSFAMERLEKEAKEINIVPPTHISYGPVTDDDLFYWEGIVIGVGPYEGGLFNLSLRFPLDYPFNPPAVNFITKVYHPCIDKKDGRVEMDILNDQWSPVITVEKLMLSIASFLSHPDVSGADPSNEIAQQYLHDMKAFHDNARKWTFKYATP